MKTAYFFRHSLKDGQNNEIGPRGFALAIAQGMTLKGTGFSYFVHGPLVRTKQTLLGLLAPLAVMPMPEDVQEVEAFGTDALFAQMVAHADFRTKAKAVGNFHALNDVYPSETVVGWANAMLEGLREAFDFLEQGETGLFVGHSPAIELALWAAGGFEDLPEEFAQLSEMDGVELQQGDDGAITVVRKIPAPEAERMRSFFDPGFAKS